MTPRADVWLLDLSGWVHRYFHAAPAFAARGVVGTVAKLVRAHEIRRLVVAEDVRGRTFRDDIFSEYKAKREERPAVEMTALLSQLRIAAERLVDEAGEEEEAGDFPLLSDLLDEDERPAVIRAAAPGYEADDVIATLARAANEEGQRVVVLAYDKDFAQLVSPGVSLWDGQGQVVGEAAVRTRYGVEARQFADYLTMVGDSSDNVPGVWGVGPKAAASVLGQFASVEEALLSAESDRAHPYWQEHGRVWARMAGARPAVELASRLVRLRRDVPLPEAVLDFVRGG